VGLAAGSLAVSLAACGSGGEGAESTDGAGGSSVTWWGWTPDKSVGDRYIAAFNKEHPDIKVEFVNYENEDYPPAIQSAMQTGRGPDVFEIAAGGQLGRSVLGRFAMDMAPIGEEALGSGWKDKYATGYVDTMTYEGTVVGLPLGGVAAGFFWINQDLFEANGVSTDIKTYGDLKTACEKFVAAGVTCFTMGADTVFAGELLRTIINSNDPSFFLQALQGQKSWDDQVVIQSLDMMRQMQADGIIGQDATSIKQYPEANNNFLSGKAAIVQMGSWYAQYAKKESMVASQEAAGVSNPTPFVMLPMTSPDFFGKGNVSGMFGETDYGMSINKDTKNLEAAKTFALWLTTTTEGQQNVANAIDLVPALKGVEADWNDLGLVNQEEQAPLFKELFAAAANPVETRNTYMSTETDKALVVAVQTALTSDTSTAEIAKQLETDAVDLPAS
jgi:ABC-type glycerol-3-phosphate transport system substrate-binding protein